MCASALRAGFSTGLVAGVETAAGAEVEEDSFGAFEGEHPAKRMAIHAVVRLFFMDINPSYLLWIYLYWRIRPLNLQVAQLTFFGHAHLHQGSVSAAPTR